jgi:hypothetical protein
MYHHAKFEVHTFLFNMKLYMMIHVYMLYLFIFFKILIQRLPYWICFPFISNQHNDGFQGKLEEKCLSIVFFGGIS